MFDKHIGVLLSAGLTLIPVSEDSKLPYSKWKGAKGTKLLELIDFMNLVSTTAVAVKLGLDSDGLFCFDIDTKFYQGFDAILLPHLEKFYPELYPKLRIERSPSGGCHIFYKIKTDKDIPSSPQLCSRLATNAELEIDSKRKSRCFVECKWNGGLTQIFPSPNYTIVQKPKNEFSELSYDEHCSLYHLISSYNEYFPETKQLKLAKDREDKYDENPFNHYDGSERGSKVLVEDGWKEAKRDARFIYFSRPENETKWISATYSLDNRTYKIWTTSTELEARGYFPSEIKAKLEFGGDKSKLYAWLVKEGFGKLKYNVERNIIKKVAKYGGKLPSNISSLAKFEFEMEKEKLEEKYPYGVFWSADENGVIRISREDLYKIANELGFKKFNKQPVKIEGYKIKKIENEDFYDEIKKYIDENEQIEVFNAYEAFIQHSGKFTVERLRNLEKNLIVRSSKLISYKFFQNVYVRIDFDKIETFEYNTIDGLIWEENIQKRDFSFRKDITESLYYKYIDLAIGWSDYLKTCIGYYAHEHRDEEGYFCIATEQCENPKDGGGSGKNIFWALFNLTTTFKSTPASMIQQSNNLLQSWNGEKVFCLSDMDKDYKLVFFKDIITGNATVNKKYVNEYSIDIEDMPKIGGSSNYSFDDADPGIKRRVRAIEFTDFFTKVGGVKKHFGKMFPKDWDDNEYTWFDNVMMECIQTYIKADNTIGKQPLSSGGWKKQFEQKYHHLTEFIEQNISEWIRIEKVTNDKIIQDYEIFKRQNGILKVSYASVKMNEAINDYCEKFNIKFNKDGKWRNGSNGWDRGRIFGNIEEDKEEEIPF